MSEDHPVEFRLKTPGRLDLALVSELDGHSRAKVQALIRQGLVQVNGRVVKKPGFAVQTNDAVTVAPPPRDRTRLEPQAFPLEVIFENEDLLVVNKPAGIVVHPGAGPAQSTLVNALLAHAPELQALSDGDRPGIVHRLDKDTSGLIVVGKNSAAVAFLQRQFKLREVEKVYLALVDGRPPSAAGLIEAPLARSPRQRKRFAVVQSPSSRAAVTKYQTRERFSKHTLLELHPRTGRTHQIRVHLQFLGCPVVGDRVYGRKNPSLPVERQQLHAWRLRIKIPGESSSREFEARIPEDLRSAIEMARGL